MHTHDTPALPPHLIERLRSGKDASLDAAIGDLHPSQTHFRHAEIHLLTHLHSDHLVGLGDKTKWPDVVICSNATKEMLLRLETQKHRIAMDVDQDDPNPPYRHLRITKKEAQATRKVTGAALKPRDVLRGLPLNTPTQIQYTQTTKLTITLIDANHMPGAVMFLIEGPRGAVLHTGDVRAEPWWIEKLRREPVLQRWVAPDICFGQSDSHNIGSAHSWATGFLHPGDEEGVLSQQRPLESTWIQEPGELNASYSLTASNLASGHGSHNMPSQLSSQTSAMPPPDSSSFVLENIYLDTECLFLTNPALSKTEAVREIIELISQFPKDTPVFINCFTWGYEELLVGICRAFGTRIHVDTYKRMMYGHLAPDHALERPEDSGKKSSIGADSHPFLLQALTLHDDRTRFHACERRNMCAWLKNFLAPEHRQDSGTNMSDRQGEASCRRDEDKGKGRATEEQLTSSSWPKVTTSPLSARDRLEAESRAATEDDVDQARTLHMHQIRVKDKIPVPSSPIAPVRAAATGAGDDLISDPKPRQKRSPQPSILHLNPTEISGPSWKKYVASIQVDIDAAKRGEKPWPRYLFVPFARHSPLPELQALTALFRPRTITPNTVSNRLGGWVYFILPRLFRSSLHRQDLAQLESECRNLLGLESWERAKVKEKELFALYQALLEKRGKKSMSQKERQRTVTTESNKSSDSAAKSSSTISIPPPGQRPPAAEVSVSADSRSSQHSRASVKNSDTSHSDSRVSNELATSSATAAKARTDQDQESSLMLLRLLDYYLHREPPALLETMVGDKLELERHLSDLRRIAVMGSVTNEDIEGMEIEMEEVLAAALLTDGAGEGDENGQQYRASTSFSTKAVPSTAGYEADVSGSVPRFTQAATAQALTRHSNASEVSDPKATQGGYDGGDERDDSLLDCTSRSTIRQQAHRQPVRFQDRVRDEAGLDANSAAHGTMQKGDALLRESEGLGHGELPPPHASSTRFSTPVRTNVPQDETRPSASAHRPPLDDTSFAMDERTMDNYSTTRSSSVIPSSPPRFSSLSLHRRRLQADRGQESQVSLAFSSQQTENSGGGEVFPPSPTGEVRAVRMHADHSATDGALEGVSSLQDQGECAGESCDLRSHISTASTQPVLANDRDAGKSPAFDFKSDDTSATCQRLKRVLLMFDPDPTLSVAQALQLRLDAYERLHQGPNLDVLGASDFLYEAEMRNELLRHVLEDIGRLQDKVSAFDDAVRALILTKGPSASMQERQTSTELDSIACFIQIGIAASYYLAQQLAALTQARTSLRTDPASAPLALLRRIASLIELLPTVLDTGMRTLRMTAEEKRSAGRPEEYDKLAQLARAGHLARMAMLSAAGLLHFVIHLARPAERDDDGLEGMVPDGALWEAKQCLGAFAKMLDEAKHLRNEEGQRPGSQLPQTGRSLQRDNSSDASGDVGSEESTANGSTRRRLEELATPDRTSAFVVPPSSSNGASQGMNDDRLNLDSLLLPAPAGTDERRRAHGLGNGGAQQGPVSMSGGMDENEGTSTESGGAISDEAVERLTRRFRLEAAQIRSRIGPGQGIVEPHPLYRPSLWATHEDEAREATSSSESVILSGRQLLRQRQVRARSDVERSFQSANRRLDMTADDEEVHIPRGISSSGPAVVLTPSAPSANHAGGMTVDVADSLWEDVSVDASAIEGHRLRMAEEDGDRRLRDGLFVGHRQAENLEKRSQDL